MPHETRNERERLVVILQEFKGDIVLVLELDTSDSHGSLAPSVALEHLLLVRTNVLHGVKCLHNQWGMVAATTWCPFQKLLHLKTSIRCCWSGASKMIAGESIGNQRPLGKPGKRKS